MLARVDVARHLKTRVLANLVVGGRVYFDSWTTPSGSLVSTAPCEHCDGEHGRHVRVDPLRGHACPSCDSALDEMLDECDQVELPSRAR